MDTKNIIQDILIEMDNMFHNAVGPRSRREYMESIGVKGRDWHFGLSANKIIKEKIPANVMGCTGRAKLFCELAKRNNRIKNKVFVVCTVKYDDWKAFKNGEKASIANGHQINAVEIDGVLRVFDAGYKKLKFINTGLAPGSFINPDYMVTAVVPAKDFEKVDTHKKLQDLYTNDAIKPQLFLRGTKILRKKIGILREKKKIQIMAKNCEL